MVSARSVALVMLPAASGAGSLSAEDWGRFARAMRRKLAMALAAHRDIPMDARR